MKQPEYLKEFFKCFQDAFINQNNEMIVKMPENIYFRLEDVESELDMKCKAIEFISRSACKDTKKKTRLMMLKSLNFYLDTDFNMDQMMNVYTYLGNGVNRKLTIEFIESGCNLKIFEV